MKKAVIVSRHTYGPGGGANAVIWFARALHDLDYRTVLYHMGVVNPINAVHLGKIGVGMVSYYEGCSHGADLLLNIDHFQYEPPLAKLNTAHIFHPHGASQASGNKANVPPKGYQLLSANSQYTELWCWNDWHMNAPHLYIPVGNSFYVGRKEQRILHVSRFSPPQDLADKGHLQLIRAFQWMCDADSSVRSSWELALAGSMEDQRYFQHLQNMAQGYPIIFYPSIADSDLMALYASSTFYWHATGASMPEIHGAQEHLGLTTLEAMASGAVPIVLGTGGQPEIISSEYDGILCTDTQTIGRVTLEFVNDLSAWSMFSRRAVEGAKPWQDYDAFVERVKAWLGGHAIPGLPPRKNPTVEFSSADVCAVIPARNESEMTLEMLKSLYKTAPNIGQVIVWDNASDEDLADALSGYLRPDSPDMIHRSEKNVTFAGVMNAACGMTDRPLLLALNNDMLCFQPNWLEFMCISMEEDVGVVGAKLLFPDGHLQHAGGVIDFNRADIGYHRWFGKEDHPGANQRDKVMFVTGACLLARRELWHWDELAGGIGMEDADLCLAARAQGYEVIYEPAARLLHYGGITRGKVPGTQVNEGESDVNRTAFVGKWFFTINDIYPWWRKMFGKEQ